MTYTLDIAVQDPAWEDIKDLESLSRLAVEKTLQLATIPASIQGKPMEISLVFANDDVVQVLNREYSGIDKPTNVLSFAMLDNMDGPSRDIVTLGDIVLAYETVLRETIEMDKFLKDHIIHLVVHGLLHLLGYDHMNDHEANDMETLEIRILQNMSIQNPYLNKVDA